MVYGFFVIVVYGFAVSGVCGVIHWMFVADLRQLGQIRSVWIGNRVRDYIWKDFQRFTPSLNMRNLHPLPRVVKAENTVSAMHQHIIRKSWQMLLVREALACSRLL